MNGPFVVFGYRGYIWRNAVNDLRYRFAGSGMGVFWNLVNPVLQIAVFGIVFGLFPSSSNLTAPQRWIYLCLGLIPWLGFTESLVRGSHSLIRGGGLVRIDGAPLEVLVAESALASALSGLLAVAVVIIASVFLGVGLRPGLILIPFVILLLHIFAYGLGLILACLRAFFVDTSEVLRVLLQLWMWTMPIVYSEGLLPEAVRPWLFLNPPWVFLREIRALGQGVAGVDALSWIVMSLWVVLSVGLGGLVLNRLRRDVLDVI